MSMGAIADCVASRCGIARQAYSAVVIVIVKPLSWNMPR